MDKVPTELQEQIHWLMDRALITELLSEFSYAIDTKNWDKAAACFAPQGVLIVPDGTIPGHKLKETAAVVLGIFHATHHANILHSIKIEGDKAKVRQSFIAMHVLDGEQLGVHGDVGGWHEMELSRTETGWRFDLVRNVALWTSGDGFPGSPGHQALMDPDSHLTPHVRRSGSDR